ncbi:MAG: O-antigen ligase family protein [Parvularculaceae bacterium]|nr:O-antigen ligase family protein [Parvularculaceae bacterium]
MVTAVAPGSPPLKPLAKFFETLGSARGDRLIMAWTLALAGIMPIVLVFMHRGVAPLGLALGAAVALRASVWRAGAPRFLIRPDLRDPLTRAALFFLGFCLWIAASAFWSPSPGAWKLVLNVGAPALAAGAVVFELSRRDPGELKWLAAVAEASLYAAAALLLFEALTGGVLRELIPPPDHSENRAKDMIALGRGVTALATIFFGGFALMQARGRKRTAMAVLFLATYVAASRLQIFANEIALTAAAIAFFVTWRAPRAAVLAVVFASLLALALAPLAAALPVDPIFAAAPDGAPISWLQRLVIWRTAAAEALGCLPFGCGAEYARDFGARTGEAAVPGAGVPLPILPIHPHNVFLEIWLELGVPGVFFFGAALVAGAEALLAARLSRWGVAAAVATAVVTLATAAVETSLWQVWRHGAIVVAVLYIALSERLGAGPPQSLTARPSAQAGS